MRSIRVRPEILARAALVGAAALLAGPLACREPLPPPVAAAHGDDDEPRRGGTLHLASFGDIRNLDPAGPQDGLGLIVSHHVFAGLVDFGSRAEIVPDLAERWDVEDDGRTYRFTLRAGVRMHDGEELTADDVKRSAERSLHPSSPNNLASYFENIAGFDEFRAKKAEHLAGVSVDGRYVVTFRLKERDATFLFLLAMQSLRPVCKTAGDRYADTWLPCGAGPFRIRPGDWRRGMSLRIVRHEDYFRAGRPYLDAIEWTFNMQAVAQRFRFLDGTLDLLRDVTQSDLARFASDPRWRPLGVEQADRTVFGESMNTRVPPFDNVEIRRAVAAAIDREHYRLVKPSSIRAATQLLPPTVAGYDPAFEGQRYDYAAALEHMRKAGYPYDPATGTGGWPSPVEYLVYDQGIIAQTAQVLQQDLAKIGIRIHVKLVSWTAFLALMSTPGRVAMGPASWEMDYPDASAFFDPLFTTAAIGPEASDNYAAYSNPRFDDLVARAHRELVPAARKAMYREANAILCDEAPWAFTMGFHFYDVRQPYVRGYASHAMWPMDFMGVWLDRAGAEAERALHGGLR